MTVAAVTRLHLRSARYVPALIFHALFSLVQARRAPGNLSVTTRRDAHGAFWTLTLWRDAEALRGFMLSGAHRKSMPRLSDWCDEASLVRFDWNAETPPSWNEAERRLKDEGRTSAVKYPNAAQTAAATLGMSAFTELSNAPAT